MKKSGLTTGIVVEGETIEMKIERIVSNKEPIKDGAPEIFTERSKGVVAAYNIRTDRWELAVDAMDAIDKSITAKRDAKAKEKYDKSEKGMKEKADSEAAIKFKEAEAEARVMKVRVVGDKSIQGESKTE